MTDLTPFNLERAAQLRKFLAEHPGVNDQATWGRWTPECGTIACAAGWTLLLHDGTDEWDTYRTRMANTLDVDEHLITLADMYGTESVPDTAAELLGLTEAQANTLFYSAVNTEQVIVLLDALIETNGDANLAGIMAEHERVWG